MRAAIVSERGRLVGSPVDEPRQPDAVAQVRTIRAHLASEGRRHGVTLSRLGLSLAGSVDVRTGRIGSAPTAPEIVGLAPRALGPGLEIDAVANDADAALWGEWRHGVAVGTRNAVGVFVGTGLGGAVIVDGKPLRGSSGVAAEMGHMVVAPDGPVCGCGGNGCLEQFASGTALERRFAELTGDREADGKAIARAAHAGLPAARAVFDELGGRLGVAIATLANVFNPEIVVVGGGVSAVSGLFMNTLHAAVDRHTMAMARRDLRISIGSLGRFAGVIGAAAMAGAEAGVSR